MNESIGYLERISMQIRVVSDAPGSVRAGALVVPVFSGAAPEGAAKQLDEQLQGAIGEVLSAEIGREFGELSLVHVHDRPYHRVLVIGLGNEKQFESHMLARYAGAAVRYLGKRNVRDVALALPPQAKGNEAACASFIAEGALAGGFDTTIYQKDPEKRSGAETLSILTGDCDRAALEQGVHRGQVIGEAVNFARRLAITPANDMTPSHLADEAQKAAKETGLEIDVLDADRCRKEGMGSFLSVAQGSAQPPKFIVLR